MTIIPNFRVTGVLAIIVSLIVLVWAAAFVERLWPWSLIAYLVWFPGEAILGYFFNDFVLKLTPIVTVATPGLLLTIVLTAFAHDIQRQTDSPETARA